MGRGTMVIIIVAKSGSETLLIIVYFSLHI